MGERGRRWLRRPLGLSRAGEGDGGGHRAEELLGECLDLGGGDEAGHDDVDADAVGRPFAGEGACEADDAGLGRGVGGLAGETGVGRRGGDEDDRRGAAGPGALAQRGERRLGEGELAAEIRVDVGLPRGLRERVGAVDRVDDAGVADDGVETAERARRALDARADRLGVAQVEAAGDRDSLERPRRERGRQVAGGDLRASLTSSATIARPIPPVAPVTSAFTPSPRASRGRTAPSARRGCPPGPCTSARRTGHGRSPRADDSDTAAARASGSGATRS